MQRGSSTWAAWALAVLAVAAAVPAALLTVLAVAQARLPYNEEGNHFDGLVVHHEGSAWVYGALAVVCWVVAILAWLGARRVFRQARAQPPSRVQERSKP